MKTLTESEARTNAAEEATPLNHLINPTDVQDGADSWDMIDADVIDSEVFESAEIIRGESQAPFSYYAHDLMLQLVRDSLTRAPMDDLVFEDERDAILAGYWPHAMNKWEAIQHIEDATPSLDDDLQHIKRECHHRAWEVVTDGIVEGMRPEVEE